MNIILGVTGGVSAYKSLSILRALISEGHKIIVCLTKNAEEFVTANSFSYLGAEEVFKYNDDFKFKNVKHIDLVKWCDSFVVCPATANTISKLTSGSSEDMIQTIFLALPDDKIKIICPAMNPEMLQKKITQDNLSKLVNDNKNLHIMKPDSGMMACGDTGEGKLPQVQDIVDFITTLTTKVVYKESNNGEKYNLKTVVIPSGATISPIDDIRYITNPSKGATGYLLAKKYLSEGYRVHVIKGINSIKEFKHLLRNPYYSEETVVTTKDLLDSVRNWIDKMDIYISPMAVSDIEFEYQTGKIKKSGIGTSLNISNAPDVLKYVLDHKKEHQQIVGFAAEYELTEEVIDEKMTRKPVDLLVANRVNSGYNGKDKIGFGTSEGEYKLVYNEFVLGARRIYDSYERVIKKYPVLKKSDLVNLIFQKIH